MTRMFARLSGVALALAMGSALAAEPAAYIVTPANGAVVKSPVTVVFGLRAPWGVAPAGINMPNTGHHHLLLDAALPDLTKAVPKDANHLHFGAGQTETSLTLAPGKHTLQLLLGDFAHVPHQPPVASEVITITVE